jgi:hypothetical protein
MKENIELIEKLNTDYLKMCNSEEYSRGQKSVYISKLLKQFKIKKIIGYLYNLRRITKTKKYSSNFLHDNDVVYNNDIKTDKKIVVYTCITGKYDNLVDPEFFDKNITYIAFCDDKKIVSSTKWIVKDIPDNIKSLNDNLLVNRYIKMHPDELFRGDNFDYSIYVDGNIKIYSYLTPFISCVSNKTGLAMHRHSLRNCIYKEYKACKLLKKGNHKMLKEQVAKYKNEGFPSEYGMFECAVIVKDLKNGNGSAILDAWWEDFKKAKSLRDQVSIPYVLWKLGYKVEDIGLLGYNIYYNPKLRILNHK